MFIQAQTFTEYFTSEGSLFNWSITFWIADPNDPYKEANYIFSKTKIGTKEDRIDKKNIKSQYKGGSGVGYEQKTLVNFNYNEMTGLPKGWEKQKNPVAIHNTSGVMQLVSYDDTSFTISIKCIATSISVELTFTIEKPDWLRSKPFQGTLQFAGVHQIVQPKNP